MKARAHRGVFPDISVVIPTYKRKRRMLETVKSFSAQTLQKFEMIIVDQGPDFISERELENLDPGFSLTCLRQDVPNLPRARNAGIGQARSGIVLFCDDDIAPDESLVERHLAGYVDAGIGGIGGRVISAGRRKERLFFKRFFPGTGLFNPLDGSLICNFHKVKRCEVKHLLGCNMSFRKELLEKAGFFDESMRGTANLEDADMSFRIRRLGFKLIFEPDAAIRHLEIAGGGCQVDNFNEFIYWLYFTDTLFFLRYFKRAFFPFFSARLFFRIPAHVFFKKDLGIIGHAARGFLDGAKKYSEEKR